VGAGVNPKKTQITTPPTPIEKEGHQSKNMATTQISSLLSRRPHLNAVNEKHFHTVIYLSFMFSLLTIDYEFPLETEGSIGADIKE
jgi:hypothetical protein